MRITIMVIFVFTVNIAIIILTMIPVVNKDLGPKVPSRSRGLV